MKAVIQISGASCNKTFLLSTLTFGRFYLLCSGFSQLYLPFPEREALFLIVDGFQNNAQMNSLPFTLDSY